MPAYNDAKVWEVPSDKTRSRPALVRSPARPAGRDESSGSRERYERNERLSVWARLAVVAILGVALLYWPYARSCGFGLAGYMAATTMVVVGGVWVVACTWIVRMPRTHVIAMIVVLWGIALITAQVLPRVGYARSPAEWVC